MVLGGLLLVAALALSPPAALIAAIVVAVRVERRLLWIAGAAGLALVALFSAVGLVDSTWAAAFRQVADAPGPGLLVDPGGVWHSFWEAATPELVYGWAAFLPLTPLLAALADLLRDKKPGEGAEGARQSAAASAPSAGPLEERAQTFR